MRRIAIIGGGAAGLACANELRRASLEDGIAASLTIFEASDKVGRSILASGNGRCNFSNAHIDAREYWNPGFVARALDAFEDSFEIRSSADGFEDSRDAKGARSCNGVVRFFERLGLLWREEADGRLYPLANKASVVLDVLRSPLSAPQPPQFGIDIECDSPVESIEPPTVAGAHFTLRLRSGELRRAEFVVVACGGHVAASTLPPEVAFHEMRPVLCPLKTVGSRTKRMDNIRVKCMASLMRDGACMEQERGEAMFRKYGLSGIAIFNLSRKAERGDVVSLDLMPDIEESELAQILRDRADDLRAAFPDGLACERFMSGMEPKPVNEVVLSDCGLDPMATLPHDAIGKIAHTLKGFCFEVEGPADPQHAQCHRGGFAVEDFTPDTMQSNDIDGLYLTGEALDVDGPCGGFNLHWAFASGIVAARDIASRL